MGNSNKPFQHPRHPIQASSFCRETLWKAFVSHAGPNSSEVISCEDLKVHQTTAMQPKEMDEKHAKFPWIFCFSLKDSMVKNTEIKV